MPWTKTYTDRSEYEKACKKAGQQLRGLFYREAIREALAQAMEKDQSVYILGEGVDDATGIFGTTLDLHKKFGRQRVFDIPVAENGMTGVAIGSAITGMKPIFVHMRMDFLLMSMDQIVNHAAKWRYMFGGRLRVPLTIRAIIGRGWGSAAQHSQSLQALFTHIPGLKVVMPSTPYEAKGLLISSINDEDPVIFIEHRWLYDHFGYVPEEMYSLPIGKGVVKRPGRDVTVIGVSYMAIEAEKAALELAGENIDVEIIDLRSFKPIDVEIIKNSVKKTGRLVIADTGWKSCGVSAEITALALETCFDHLKAPIVRVALPDVPTPASSVLEQKYYPGVKNIVAAVKEVMHYQKGKGA